MILDASAFYAGVPFVSPVVYHTTPQVYAEIMHIKKAQDAAQTLQDIGRLVVMQPQKDHVERALAVALSTGDLPTLSEPDISVLALASQTGLEIITDDYAISNSAHAMGIRSHAVMTKGPTTFGQWVYRCPSCQKRHPPGDICDVCGATLSRRLSDKMPSRTNTNQPTIHT